MCEVKESLVAGSGGFQLLNLTFLLTVPTDTGTAQCVHLVLSGGLESELRWETL